jgi:hypothetical protein
MYSYHVVSRPVHLLSRIRIVTIWLMEGPYHTTNAMHHLKPRIGAAPNTA